MCTCGGINFCNLLCWCFSSSHWCRSCTYTRATCTLWWWSVYSGSSFIIIMFNFIKKFIAIIIVSNLSSNTYVMRVYTSNSVAVILSTNNRKKRLRLMHGQNKGTTCRCVIVNHLLLNYNLIRI